MSGSGSLPDANPSKTSRLRWPTGMPQIVALVVVLLVDSVVANNFFSIHI